ncbi:GNAT family N-acetyltransferase [Saccharibacillus endophyticus]|uniref:N-acetyltransferase n=1 Tax=Saccharibacillus endophyticus TaxID=2060666 RepID=A0ABQ1ZLW6_9BACL|nr:GNAT family N-acetyltransferase [Saccharibacillus endophyticus]GGH68566.1 N-acetyltransferase [Saccharibacillus endophyticus]
MNDFLSPSTTQIAAIERSEIDYMTDRMLAIQSRPGNPEGVEIRNFGSAVAFTSKTMPWPSFNTVKGITDASIEHLEEILDFYRENEAKVQLEIVPSRVGPDFLRKMSESGLYQSGFHCSLAMTPEQGSMTTSEQGSDIERIAIRKLEADEFELYATLHCRGTGLPDNGISHVRSNNEVLHDREGWNFFAAELDGAPAATAVLFEKEGLASLTFAATLPEFRRQGLQRRLLEHRVTEAFSRPNKLVVGQCAFLSQSHRNMEHVGMKLGYIRTAWTSL